MNRSFTNIHPVKFQWRWVLVTALFFITVINYVDRQSLSLLAPWMQRQMSLSDRAYGHIVTVFLLAYTLSYLLAGYITDRLGSRRSMTLFVVWWSLAEMLPPFARSGLSLGASRFLLGFGEAGNYVAAPKAITEHFGPANRALAIGIYTAGATMGAAIAPPLVSQVSSRFGWPMVFFVTGLAGLVWVLPWLWIHRRLGQQPPDSLPSTEDPIARASHTASSGGWSPILRQPQTWWLLVARFLTDPVWYFYLFWYPKYLQQSRHLSLSQTGHSAWVVYLAADVGTILGGWIALPLIRAGMQTPAVRRGVMTVAASAMLLSPLIVVVSSIRPMLGIASVIVFAHMAWLVTLTATILDRYPSSVVGVATGIIAAGSGLGGMLSSEIISAIVMHSGYTPLFWGMSLLHPLALLFYWQLKPLRPVKAANSLFQPSSSNAPA